MMQVESCQSSPEEEKPSPSPQFDRDVRQLSDWLSSQMRRVYVGDVADIEKAVINLRVSGKYVSNVLRGFFVSQNSVGCTRIKTL